MSEEASQQDSISVCPVCLQSLRKFEVAAVNKQVIANVEGIGVLNPTAYRECVEALKECDQSFDHAERLGIIVKTALQHAEGKEATK